MTGLRVELHHTGLLAADVLAQARMLLDEVFAGELTADDWEHCLGGLHALAWQDGELVGHAALVQRRLLHAGRVLRAGYVEGVAVRRPATTRRARYRTAPRASRPATHHSEPGSSTTT